MSWEQIAKILGTVLVLAFEHVQKSGSSELKEAFSKLETILESVRQPGVGSLDHKTVKAEIEAFRNLLLSSDNKADADLREKFHVAETE